MVEYEDYPERLVLKFTGRQDTAACQELATTIRERLASVDKTVDFNLHGVDYVSSAFLRICLQTAKSVGAERFQVSNLSPTVKKVFKIAGFDQILKGA